MKTLYIKDFTNIKFVEKNDKKSKCAKFKTDLNPGDPVWVLSKQTNRGHRFNPKAKDDSVPLIALRTKKYSNKAAFSFFFSEPHQFLRLLKESKETTKSLTTLIRDQFRTWVQQATEKIDVFEKTSLMSLVTRIVQYTHSYFDGFQKLQIAIEQSKYPVNKDFDFDPTSEQYYMRRLIAGPTIDYQSLERKFHAIKEIFTLLIFFKEKFELHTLLTHDETCVREIAKCLTKTPQQTPQELANLILKEMYPHFAIEAVNLVKAATKSIDSTFLVSGVNMLQYNQMNQLQTSISLAGTNSLPISGPVMAKKVFLTNSAGNKLAHRELTDPNLSANGF